jgi:hypothetical protein
MRMFLSIAAVQFPQLNVTGSFVFDFTNNTDSDTSAHIGAAKYATLPVCCMLLSAEGLAAMRRIQAFLLLPESEQQTPAATPQAIIVSLFTGSLAGHVPAHAEQHNYGGSSRFFWC